MKNTLSLLLALLSAAIAQAGNVSFAPGAQPDHQIAGFMSAFAEAVNAGNGAPLADRLSPRYAIEGLPTEMAPRIFQQAIAQTGGGLESIVINSVETEGDLRVAKMEFHFAKSTDPRVFKFDRDGRLVSADFFKIGGGGGGHHTPPPAMAATKFDRPDRLELPAELAGGILFVEAEVDGRRGLFAFDSGSPFPLILNNAIFSNPAANGADVVSRGAGGEFKTKRVRVGSFKLGELHGENFDAMTGDIGHLGEDLGGRPLFGIIGQYLFRESEIVYDYAQRKITCYALDAHGQTKAPHQFGAPKQIVPFELKGHLPVFTAKIGGETYRLGLDSGAAGGLLDQNLKTKLAGVVRPFGTGELVGADGKSAPQERVLADLDLGGGLLFKDTRFTYADVSALHAEGGGLVGFQLLSPRPSAVNYVTKQLKFW